LLFHTDTHTRLLFHTVTHTLPVDVFDHGSTTERIIVIEFAFVFLLKRIIAE
jgi:hypothetical protein